MKTIYKKYGSWIIILLLLCWIILTPYPFQKGGLEKPIYYFIIVGFIFLVTGLITLLFDNFNKIERLIVTVILSTVSLFVVTILIMPFIENLFSGDYTRFFWETKDRILINTIFYGLTLAFVATFCSLYNSVKKRKTRKIISAND